MITNILQHKNLKANFSKIINYSQETISTESNQIKKDIEEYYTNLYKPNNPLEIPTNWKKIYHPIPTIKEKYYDNLLSKITKEEIQQTIILSSKNKAPEPNQISFDIIKKIFNQLTLTLLENLFNKILIKN